MSACDTCRDPGACCRMFHLSRSFKPEQTKDQVRELLRDGFDGWGRCYEPLPFEPVRPNSWYAYEPEEDDAPPMVEWVEWTVTCPRLDEETGRCTIYAQRPTLCQEFEPLSNVLCVEAEVPLSLITLCENVDEGT